MPNMQIKILDKTKNKVYFKILDEVNYYIGEWNRLNTLIEQISIPKIPSRDTKKKLLKIGENAEKFNNKYQTWLENINPFLVNPSIYVTGSVNPNLTFSHFKELLLRRVRETEDMFRLVNNNYKIKDGAYKNQFNFNIAIFGVIISLCALSITFLSELNSYFTDSDKILIDSIDSKINSYFERNTDQLDSTFQEIKVTSANFNKILIDSMKIELNSYSEGVKDHFDTDFSEVSIKLDSLIENNRIKLKVKGED
jgi:hypothetical protein